MMFGRKNRAAATATETPAPATVRRTPPPERPARRARGQQVTALLALCGHLDRLDLGAEADPLADAKAQLELADARRAEFATASRNLRERYATLRDQVRDGDLTPARAVDQLANVAPVFAAIEHESGTLAERLADEVADEHEFSAVCAAQQAAPAIRAALEHRAAEIVAATVDTAAALIDLDAYVGGIEKATGSPRWDEQHGCLAGWPRLDLANVEPMKWGQVGVLRDHLARFRQLWEVLGPLQALAPGAGQATLYRKPGRRDDRNYLTRWCPEELQLPVGARLGWEPGLWPTTAKPAMPGDLADQIARDATRAAVGSVPDQQLETRALTGR